MVAELCLTLCNSMNYSPPGSSIHEIFQTRILEGCRFLLQGDHPKPRGPTWVSCFSCTGRWILYHWATKWNYPVINVVSRIHAPFILKIFIKSLLCTRCMQEYEKESNLDFLSAYCQCSGSYTFRCIHIPLGDLVKMQNLLLRRQRWVQFLGQEDPLEKEMATHSSILVWKIPWTEEPGGL